MASFQVEEQTGRSEDKQPTVHWISIADQLKDGIRLWETNWGTYIKKAIPGLFTLNKSFENNHQTLPGSGPAYTSRQTPEAHPLHISHVYNTCASH